MTAVRGRCPMGCGETLFVGSGGHITCWRLKCPQPDAVATILAEPETEHIVNIQPFEFAVMHPLRERLGQQLLHCDLHQHLVSLTGPPVTPGRYRALLDGGTWRWEEVEQT